MRALGSETHPVDYAIDCHYNVGADQLVLFAGAYEYVLPAPPTPCRMTQLTLGSSDSFCCSSGTFHAFNVTADAVHRGLTFTGGHTDTVRCVTWNPEVRPASRVARVVPAAVAAH